MVSLLSKCQSGLPRRFGKGLDPAMEFVTVSVKANTLDSDTESLLGDSLAYHFSSLLVSGIVQLFS